MVDYLEGILKIGNLFLAVVAGYLAISLFSLSKSKSRLKPWSFLIFGLVLFAIQMILGFLRAFEIYTSPYLTHIVPTAILGLLITALFLQINLGGD
ncbi:hypothetical protein HYU14_02900 [Candidatus Woesearchaeota archaeon]|nr:hypothetical protein [Candidatus Woesearchaeota archaeon]